MNKSQHQVESYDLITETEWAWLAGLLEGEGCFGLGKNSGKRSASASVNMTDEDVVRRVYDMLGGSFRGPSIPTNPKHKPVWYWRLGKRHQLHQVLTHIRPYMGKRRGARIDEILHIYQLVEKEKTTIIHGTRKGYDSGCKCNECKASNAQRARERRKAYATAKPTTAVIGCVSCRRESSLQSFKVHYALMHNEASNAYAYRISR